MKSINDLIAIVQAWIDRQDADGCRGWAKAKKANKRIAKKRERRRYRKEMEEGEEE